MVKQVKDYVDRVQEKFPYLSKSEINKIITFGLKRYSWINKMHGDVLLKNMTEHKQSKGSYEHQAIKRILL